MKVKKIYIVHIFVAAWYSKRAGSECIKSMSLQLLT